MSDSMSAWDAAHENHQLAILQQERHHARNEYKGGGHQLEYDELQKNIAGNQIAEHEERKRRKQELNDKWARQQAEMKAHSDSQQAKIKADETKQRAIESQNEAQQQQKWENMRLQGKFEEAVVDIETYTETLKAKVTKLDYNIDRMAEEGQYSSRAERELASLHRSKPS
jgi:hypothetical protein